MESGNRIEITDKDGWRKEVPLQKRLVYIGSDARNDVVLSPLRGEGVAPKHLQIINEVSGAEMRCRAVNLSGAAIAIGEGGARMIAPNTALLLTDGDSLHLGDYLLCFHLDQIAKKESAPDSGGVMAAGAVDTSIGLRLMLSQSTLAPGSPLEGVVYVANLGKAPGVQFALALEGLPADCYQIAPVPILFPGAEKGVSIRLTHPERFDFPAGPLKLVLRASAEEAYPAGSVSLSRTIHVMPIYRHTVKISVGA